MLSSSFASLLRLNISDSRTFPPSHYGGRYNQLNDNGTSHFVIVDGERNAVSVTSTVNTAFGSKILSKSTGILLNNEMDDFSKPGEKNVFNLPPAKKNFIRPGKRPLSSMGPFIVLQVDFCTCVINFLVFFFFLITRLSLYLLLRMAVVFSIFHLLEFRQFFLLRTSFSFVVA